MKVVHVVEALAGGVHTYFKDLSDFFGDPEVNKNVQTTIIYSSKREQVAADKITTQFSKGVQLIELNMERELSPFQDLKTIYQLAKLIHNLKPDVLHLHSSKAGVVGRVASLLSFRKPKLFYSPHGYSFLRTDISNSKRNLFKAIETNAQRIFGGQTIACGDTEYTIAKEIGTSHLIRNGINVNAIASIAQPVTSFPLTIGIVGRITHARNPQLFNDIALRFPEYNFLWIGGGELETQLTAPNITITGWLIDRELALQQLSTVAIYLQTSLWEGLPIAVLEAMAMQKPVIATNIIGNKDVVVPNKTGVLFNSIAELDAHLKLLNDEKRRAELGANGLRRVQEFFDSNANFKALLGLYYR